MQYLEQHQVERQWALTPSSQTKLEHRNKTSNPPNRLPGSRTRAQNLSNNYQYDLYWTLFPPYGLRLLCGSGMQG